MLRYQFPLTAALIATDYKAKKYNYFAEIITNSQDALWKFINHFQITLNQNSEIYKEPIVTPEIMGQLIEQQNNFYKDPPEYVMYELIDIGVFGFLFIGKSGQLKKGIANFFSDSLSEIENENKYFEEVII